VLVDPVITSPMSALSTASFILAFIAPSISLLFLKEEAYKVGTAST
jgi:hypothetical protein